ncbi:hypothetical protein BDA99DRAFT_509472 [Phascolomyces articulosus]|uniref:Uncharacterized protein n=1 Tax=Phascolomyces articulosus TaxID=60185 RepID=A0AAD5PDV5_9FUNG|nr:hypothetical protein BDA99DRAFT_509472 [Phascolomyces articulosus]
MNRNRPKKTFPSVEKTKKRLRHAINGYTRFILRHYPDRLRDGRPLFPMTLKDLLLYIDYKTPLCLYWTMRKNMSVLHYHPAHGDKWKKNVLENLIVLKKFNELREAADVEAAAVAYQNNNGSSSLGHSSVSDNDESDNNDESCQIIPGEKKGFMITKAKPLIFPPTPSLAPPALAPASPEGNISSKQKTRKLVPVRRTLKNGIITMNLDADLLASKVRVIPYMTPIIPRQLPSIPSCSPTIVIKPNEADITTNSSSSV